MNAETSGVLAIWNSVAPGEDALYERWFQSEHLAERLGVPGFRRGRRYRALGPGPGYFVYYETDTPEILTSPAYLARVNTPTPLTRRVMAEVFRDMSRTVCRVAYRTGQFRGAFAATLRLPETPPNAVLAETLAGVADDPAIARAEAWTATGDRRESEESRLRGGDKSVGACLFVETLEAAAADEALAALARRWSGEGGTFRLLCELTATAP